MTDSIGFTSTVPVEAIIAAGYRPVDLNNIFINTADPLAAVLEAERKGFPRNLCSWIKGIYTVAKQCGIDKVICIGEGDCASSVSMCEVLHSEGVDVIPFSYSVTRDPKRLKSEIERLARRLGTTMEASEETRRKLLNIRNKLNELDRLTWEERKVRGQENHYWLVSASDFNGDPIKFESELNKILQLIRERKPGSYIPLAYIGVPPIVTGIYNYLNELGADVIFNETQRQFAFIEPSKNLVEQYRKYTYPYGIVFRLETDILPEIKKRGCRGIIHYVQSFCHRQVEDIILKAKVGLPMLTVEMDKPGLLDNRTKIRLEAFVEML